MYILYINEIEYQIICLVYYIILYYIDSDKLKRQAQGGLRFDRMACSVIHMAQRCNGGTGGACPSGTLSVDAADREKDWLALFCRVGLRPGRESLFV